MAIALDYKVVPEWPVLSWLAVCEIDSDRVFVLHGIDVQTNLIGFAKPSGTECIPKGTSIRRI